MIARLLGLGAVGAPIAVRLAPKCDFAAIATGDRAKRLEAEGVTVNGTTHHFPIDLSTKADLVILCCKNGGLNDALDDIAPIVGDGTTIMSLLNGVDSEGIIARRYGEEKVLPAFITSLSSVREGDRIDCFSPRGGNILFGERDGSISERVRKIGALFTEAGVWHTIPDDITHEIWWKFSLNVCVNTISACLGLDYSGMNSNEPFQRAFSMMYREVRAVAALEGVTLTKKDEEKVLEVMRGMDGPGKTSMLQDLEAGRPTENKWFCRSVSAIGARGGVPTPICDYAYNLVEAASRAKELM